MKKLLALALVLMVAGGAMAQTPYDYLGCSYRLGVFFSDNTNTFEVSSEATNYDYTQFVGFYMHLVAIDCPEMLSAYEMNMEGLPAGAIVSWEAIAGSGWINIGTVFNQIAAFGFPQPNPDGVTHLGRWNIIALTGGVAANVTIGPSIPSSVGGDGPGMVVNGELWRMNYTPFEFSGCIEDLAPSETPVLVGTNFGPGVEIDGEIVAVEAMSLTNVKALFN